MRIKLHDKHLDRIRTSRIGTLLFDYFKNGSPITLYEDGTFQCGGERQRTFNDLYSLVKYYIPSATKKKVAYYLLKLSIKYKRDVSYYKGKHIAIGSIYCGTTGGATFGARYHYFVPYSRDFDLSQGKCDRSSGCATAISYDQVEKLAYEHILQRDANRVK